MELAYYDRDTGVEFDLDQTNRLGAKLAWRPFSILAEEFSKAAQRQNEKPASNREQCEQLRPDDIDRRTAE